MMARFQAESETYWANASFETFDETQAAKFRKAIDGVRHASSDSGSRFYADIEPFAYQRRVLEALLAARAPQSFRNLVVAATGTGKTVIAAFDYRQHRQSLGRECSLLFVAHRKEILEQARDCFRAVLKDFDFGELYVDGHRPTSWEAVFASVQSLSRYASAGELAEHRFGFVVVDEVHHGQADSYRFLFDSLEAQILLGLSATPERMDGRSILPDFDNRYAAEIRLPEALEEKLLCPFHYFGVSDPVSVAGDHFWSGGRYNVRELENVYTQGSQSTDRLNAIFGALHRYFPELSIARCVGFCASVEHAHFMAACFSEKGLNACALTSGSDGATRQHLVSEFRSDRLQFLFVVDIFNEGGDVPEINLVMFLRPTESLTVFLQQLGRGLRVAPEKDCLTVLDFVGQTHRRYRVDRKLSALLRSSKSRIDREIVRDFPHLPPGCSIQFEKVAKEHVLENVKKTLGNLQAFIPESINTFETDSCLPLSFGHFVEQSGISPIELLRRRTWSEWQDLARGTQLVDGTHLGDIRSALRRIALRTDIALLEKAFALVSGDATAEQLGLSQAEQGIVHYLLWGKNGKDLGVDTYQQARQLWANHTSAVQDLREILEWRRTSHPSITHSAELPFTCPLRVHAAYGLREITAAFGKADLHTTGPAGTGVVHLPDQRAYIHLVTFQKRGERLLTHHSVQRLPDLLHWETQAATTQTRTTGQKYLNFQKLDYTILFFARYEKSVEGETAPFTFLGRASELVSAEGARPIRMKWRLEQAIPAELYEQSRSV